MIVAFTLDGVLNLLRKKVGKNDFNTGFKDIHDVNKGHVLGKEWPTHDDTLLTCNVSKVFTCVAMT